MYIFLVQKNDAHGPIWPNFHSPHRKRQILSVKCLYFPICNSKNVSYCGSLYECAIFLSFPHVFLASLNRPLVKSAYQKNNFLISQPKHMLWVLKRTVSMRRFFWAPLSYAKIYGLENIYNFTLKIFVYLNLCLKPCLIKMVPLSINNLCFWWN